MQLLRLALIFLVAAIPTNALALEDDDNYSFWVIQGGGQTTGTASRNWTYAWYNFNGLTPGDTIPARIGTLDLDDPVAPNYTTGGLTTELNVASLGVDANSAMTITGAACHWSAALSFPGTGGPGDPIADGDPWLVRTVYCPDTGWVGGRLSGFGPSGADLVYTNATGDDGLFRFWDTSTLVEVNNTNNVTLDSCTFADKHFNAALAMTNCIEGACTTTDRASDPGTFPAGRFAILGQPNNCLAGPSSGVRLVGVWVAIGSASEAGVWNELRHDEDCAGALVSVPAGCL